MELLQSFLSNNIHFALFAIGVGQSIPVCTCQCRFFVVDLILNSPCIHGLCSSRHLRNSKMPATFPIRPSNDRAVSGSGLLKESLLGHLIGAPGRVRIPPRAHC